MEKFIPILVSAIPTLVHVLSKRGARPFTVTLSTSPKFLKKSRDNGDILAVENPELLGVRKVSVINCFLNFNYTGAVNRQREREESKANFQARANWFEHIPFATSALVRSKADTTKLYVQLKIEKILSVEYVGASGERWTRKAFEAEYSDYLPLPGIWSNKAQGTTKPILTMTPSLDSILGFTVDGQTYAVGKDKAMSEAFRESGKSYVGLTSTWPKNADLF